MINHCVNEDGNEKLLTYIYDINSPRSRHILNVRSASV